MKTLKRIAISLLILFFTLLFLTVGIATWVIHNPKQAWHFVETRILPEDLKITWDEMNFSSLQIQSFRFRVDWNIRGLSILKKEPLLDLRFQNIKLSTTLFPKDLEQKLIVHDLLVQASDPLQIVLMPSKDESQKNIFQSAQQILEILNRVKSWVLLENLKMDMAQLSFARGSANPFIVSAQAKRLSDLDQIDLLLNLELPDKKSAEKPMRIISTHHLRLNDLDTEKEFFNSNIEVVGSGIQTQQELSVVYNNKEAQLKSEGKIVFAAKDFKLIIHPVLKIHINEKNAETELKGAVSGIPGPLVQILGLKAKLKTPLEKDIFWSEKPSNLSVQAPIDLFFVDKKMRTSLEQSCKCKLPEALNASLDGEIWLSQLFSEPSQSKPLLATSLNLESLDNKLLLVNLAAKLRIEKTHKEYTFYPEINLSAAINSFQGLRKILDSKNILVPTPIDAMDGTITLKASGPIGVTEEAYTLPSKITIALASARQKMNIDLENSLTLKSNWKSGALNVNMRVQDLQIEMPPLDPLKGKPRVTLDSRILKKPKEVPVTPKFKMAFTFSVVSVTPGAVRLLSKFFEPYMPISFAVDHPSNSVTTGFIKTEPFDVVYLRRRVHVEKMKLDLAQVQNGLVSVDGRLRVKQTQYTIFIDIKGPANKPEVVMSSEPYLDQSSIISVLLYDRTNDQLVGNDAETAGNVRAAMADRAIGLFGLWAFAGTPIKSFSYNPVTKVYSATVALTDDTTAGIGTNWEESAHLELRKRISEKWILTVSWTPATQDERETTKLILQWENRY